MICHQVSTQHVLLKSQINKQLSWLNVYTIKALRQAGGSTMLSPCPQANKY